MIHNMVVQDLHCLCRQLTQVVVLEEVRLRFLARTLDNACSAISARTSASCRSCCTLRYLTKLIVAISSCE